MCCIHVMFHIRPSLRYDWMACHKIMPNVQMGNHVVFCTYMIRSRTFARCIMHIHERVSHKSTILHPRTHTHLRILHREKQISRWTDILWRILKETHIGWNSMYNKLEVLYIERSYFERKEPFTLLFSSFSWCC